MAQPFGASAAYSYKILRGLTKLFKDWNYDLFPSGEEFGKLLENNGQWDIVIHDNAGNLLYQSDK